MPVWPVFYCLVKAQGRTGLVDEGLQQSEQGHSEAMVYGPDLAKSHAGEGSRQFQGNRSLGNFNTP